MKYLLFSFYLLLVWIPFGTKKFIYAFSQPVSELNSIFLYGSDLLLILFLVFFFIVRRNQVRVFKNVFLSLFLIFALISVFIASFKVFAFYQFFRLLLVAIAALVIGRLLKEGAIGLKQIAATIAGTSVFQAFVAVFQFRFFRSSGLWFLGEPVVNVFTQNVARFRIDGLTFLRGFGTLPHANILAAFLILGLLSFCYLYLRSKNHGFFFRLILVVGLFIVSLALVFTFSRSGWLVAGIVTLLVVLWGLFNKDFRKQTISLIVILFTTFYLLFSNFNWLILPRVQLSASEPSVSYRWLYNEIGWNVIKNNPLGVGLGNQLFYAMDNDLYRPAGIIHQKDWQPVHNIYLLIASEIGILGLLSFLIWILGFRIWNLFRNSNLEFSISTLMLISILLFGLVDHFPWTLQNGRLMLWLAIGLVLGLGLRNNELKSS